VQGSGFRVQGSGFRVQGSGVYGCRVALVGELRHEDVFGRVAFRQTGHGRWLALEGLGAFIFWGLGLRVWVLGFIVRGLGFRVRGSGFRV